MKEVQIEITELENQRIRLSERIKEYRKRVGLSAFMRFLKFALVFCGLFVCV